jgi:hypothetical protein
MRRKTGAGVDPQASGASLEQSPRPLSSPAPWVKVLAWTLWAQRRRCDAMLSPPTRDSTTATSCCSALCPLAASSAAMLTAGKLQSLAPVMLCELRGAAVGNNAWNGRGAQYSEVWLLGLWPEVTSSGNSGNSGNSSLLEDFGRLINDAYAGRKSSTARFSSDALASASGLGNRVSPNWMRRLFCWLLLETSTSPPHTAWMGAELVRPPLCRTSA